MDTWIIPLAIAGPVVLLALVVGFLAGAEWVARQLTRR